MVSKRLAWGWATAAGVLGAALASAAATESEPSWGDTAMPSTPAMAIGGHARGCLAGAEPLPLDGVGYQVMRPSRNRFYGHPVAIDFVREFAAAMRAKGWNGLLVGDLEQPRFVKITSTPDSHPTCLHVDLSIFPSPER